MESAPLAEADQAQEARAAAWDLRRAFACISAIPAGTVKAFRRFNGANSHVSEIGRISEALAAGISENEIINYRTGDAEKRETPKLLTSVGQA